MAYFIAIPHFPKGARGGQRRVDASTRTALVKEAVPTTVRRIGPRYWATRSDRHGRVALRKNDVGTRTAVFPRVPSSPCPLSRRGPLFAGCGLQGRGPADPGPEGRCSEGQAARL